MDTNVWGLMDDSCLASLLWMSANLCSTHKEKTIGEDIREMHFAAWSKARKNDMHYLFLPRLFMFVDLVWLFCLCLLSEWWFLYDSILKSACFERHMLLKNVNGTGWMPVFFSTKALVKWLFCYTRAFQCDYAHRVAPLSFLTGKLCHPLSVWVLIRIWRIKIEYVNVHRLCANQHRFLRAAVLLRYSVILNTIML